MPLTLVRPRIMTWAGNNLTDHNRSPLAISIERIENVQRMANGSMRKVFIADKRTFSCSWEMVPASASKTVDGFWGGQSIVDFYESNPNSFELKVFNGDGTNETYTVFFTAFSSEITKRGVNDFWNVNVTMEEA